MGFLKSGAIKSTTRKRMKQVSEGIEMFYQKPIRASDEGIAIKKALLEYLKSIESVGGPRLTFPFNIDNADWTETFSFLVVGLVEAELSYDPSMGSQKDRELIIKTIKEKFQR